MLISPLWMWYVRSIESEVIVMAMTKGGKKKVHVPTHKRNGKTVKEHYRSTRN